MDAGELAVQGRDLRPVRRVVDVEGRDRRLEDVRPPAAERERAVEARPALCDPRRVPERAVLVGEQDDRAVREPRVAPGVVQEHQGQQRMDFWLVGHQRGERAAEPDRLRGEVGAAAVALVEDEVDDRQHRSEPVGQEVRRRYAEGDPRRPDLPFRADEPLGHRLLGDEERPRDLLRAEAAERSQRERDLRVELERRVAAREDELEALVRDRRLVHLVLHGLGHVEQAGLLGERAVAADAVDRAIPRRRHQPRPRARGRPVAWPALGRDRERLLRGLLGEVEVAEEADQGGEDATPLVAEGLVERPTTRPTGRTSTAPPRRAAGTREASSIAASRSSASKRK